MRCLSSCVCLLVCLSACVGRTSGLVFTRCQLTRALINNNVSKTFLSNWVCLIEQESQRNTSAFVQKSSTRKYYGLYQIQSEWCKEGRRGGGCNLRCEDLLDDDISDDTRCAQLIFETRGFKYWRRWETRCKNNRLPDIEKCPDFFRSTSSTSTGSRGSPPRLRRRRRRTDAMTSRSTHDLMTLQRTHPLAERRDV